MVVLFFLNSSRGCSVYPIFQGFFSAELNFTLLIYIDDFDFNLIAFLNFIAYIFNATITDLRDVNQSIGTWENFYKGTEVDDLFNLAEINSSYLNFLGKVLDKFYRFCCRFGIRLGDGNQTIVIDVDGNSRLVDNFTNDFTARSYDIPNLVFGYHESDNSRCVLVNFIAVS